MKKLFLAITFLVPIAIGMFSCDNVEKLDKQLYDSTEANTPVTKLDQLDAIDKADKKNDSLETADPK